MSSSGNVFKSNFIRYTDENTRIIDTSELVAKRLQSIPGLVRENSEKPEKAEGFTPGLEEFYGESPELDMLTEPVEGEEAPGVISAEEINASLEKAQAEYDEIINRANAEAEAMLAAARAEAEQIKTNAYAEGLAKGQAETEAFLSEKVAEMDAYAENLNAEYENQVKAIEPLMVEVISGVYKKVFSEGIFDNKSVFYSLINKALLHIEASGPVTIYVAMSDLDLVLSMKEDLIARTTFKYVPEIMGREDFKPGQMKIETPFGIVDCGLDTQLDELTDALKVLSFEE